MRGLRQYLENILAYYESENCDSNYDYVIVEDLQYNAVERIKNNRWFAYQGFIGYTDEQVEKAVNKIIDNLEEYTSRYSNYYVGDNSIGGISFGEEEEQICDAGKLNKQQVEIAEDMGFYVGKNTDEEILLYYYREGEGLNVSVSYEHLVHLIEEGDNE